MADHAQPRFNGSTLVTLAAVVVIVAGLRTAQAIVVPFIVAAFLAMICLPPLRWLQDKGLPTWAALLVITFVVVVVGVVIVGIVGNSINELRRRLPDYEARVAAIQDDALNWLNAQKLDVGFKLSREDFDAQRAVSLFGSMLGAIGSLLGNAMVIVFTLIFMLLEAADFPAKLRAIGNERVLTGNIAAVQANVRRYVTIRTQMSLANGVLVSAWLWLLGIDFALLWGLLSFLFNFIPNIGSLLAAIPAVTLAFLQKDLATAVYAAAGYMAIELVIGYVVEPRLMGRGLGLSPLVVFTSLILWGWVLGPLGMLLSVPLTMVVKIALDTSQEFRWLGVLLSADPPRTAAPPKGRRRK